MNISTLKSHKTVVIIAAVAILGTIGVGIEANHVQASQLDQANRAYDAAVTDNKTAYADLQDAVTSNADSLKAATPNNNKYKETLTKFTKSYNDGVKDTKAKPVYKTITVDTSDKSNVEAATVKLAADTTRVNAVKTSIVKESSQVLYEQAKQQLADALNRADIIIKKAQGTYEGSAGKVADEKTRTDLKASTDAMIAARATKNPDKINPAIDSLAKAEDAVGASVDARTKQIEAEQAAAAAAAQAQSQASGSGYGSSYSGAKRSYSGSTVGSYSGGGYSVSAYCSPNPSDPVCQNAVDRGGLTGITYDTGTKIYAQHVNTGGNWINGLQIGQTVNVNGKKYQVTSNKTNQKYAPDSGEYLQTCVDSNGTNIRLVGIKPVG